MSKQIIIYGLHAVRHCLEYSSETILELWISKHKQEDYEQFISLAESNRVSVQIVSSSTIENKVKSSQHQDIAILRKPYPNLNEIDLKKYLDNHSTKNKLFLILDNVQDPHNLGACFRTADAVNCDGIIVAKDRSVQITPTVCKVASGAVETVAFYSVTNLARTMRQLKENNIWLYGLDGDAESDLYQSNLSGSVAFVMGAEGQGLRDNTRKHCDQLLKIPMLGKLESLNVSVATGIVLFEAVRQQQIVQ